MMSASYSDRHCVNWSSGGIEATMPRYVPPFSIVAMSIVEVVPDAVGHDRVARLVHGDRVALALDVLDVLGRAEVLELLRLDDVGAR